VVSRLVALEGVGACACRVLCRSRVDVGALRLELCQRRVEVLERELPRHCLNEPLATRGDVPALGLEVGGLLRLLGSDGEKVPHLHQMREGGSFNLGVGQPLLDVGGSNAAWSPLGRVTTCKSSMAALVGC
jgi:hypothetical protein